MLRDTKSRYPEFLENTDSGSVQLTWKLSNTHTSTSEMCLLWHCWLRRNDKFHFQLAFFRDVINEIFIHLRLTRITFPWNQGKQKTLQENIWMCVIHLSPSAQKPSQRHPRWIPYLKRNYSRQKGKLEAGEGYELPSNTSSFNGWQDSLQRQAPNLPKTRCFRWHLSAHPSPAGNRELVAAPVQRQADKGFMQPLP